MVTAIPINQLSIGASHTRSAEEYKESKLKELAEDISKRGITDPVHVRVLQDGKLFEVIDGRRRTQAARMVSGMKEIPAIIHELDNTQAVEFELKSFLTRKELTVFEEANGLQMLMTLHKGDFSQVCKATGKKQSYIRHRLSLTRLIPSAQAAYNSEALSFSHILALTPLAQEAQKTVMRHGFVNEHAVSTREWNKIIASLNKEGKLDGTARRGKVKTQRDGEAEQLSLFAVEQLKRFKPTRFTPLHLRALAVDRYGKTPAWVREKYKVGPEADLRRLSPLMLTRFILDSVAASELRENIKSPLLALHKVDLKAIRKQAKQEAQAEA